jgi:predicted HicB family RNase H-like nuclease
MSKCTPHGKILVRCETELHKKLKEMAQEADIPLNQFIIRVLSQVVNTNKQTTCKLTLPQRLKN